MKKFQKLKKDEKDDEDEEDIYDEEENNKESIIISVDNLNNEEDEDKEEKPENETVKYHEEDKEVGQEEVSDIIYEGFMQKKTYKKWQSRYFQIKNGYLYWFKDKSSSVIQNKISIKNTLRVESHKDKKFKMVLSLNTDDDKESKENVENGEKTKENDKVYKFACQSNEERDVWVNAINKEMIRLQKGDEKIKRYKLEIPLRKKVIKDHYNLPGFNGDFYYMRKTVLEEMECEEFFKPSERKLEALKRRKMRQEKEKLGGEKEKGEMKKIGEDKKSGKDAGITNKLKFWFKSNV